MGKANKNARAPKKSPVWGKILGWGLGILFVLTLVFGLLHTTGVLQRSIPAVTVGDMKVTALDYAIYYGDVRNNFLTQYGNTLAALGLPTDSSLDRAESFFDDGSTWGEYFSKEAVTAIQQTLSLYQEAKAAGHTLTEAYQKLYNDRIASYVENAIQYGMSTDGFVASMYGSGVKMADLERVYTVNFFAEDYGASIRGAYDISEADIEAKYQESRTTYDVADYDSFTFAYESFTYTAPAEGESVPEGQPASEAEATQMTEASKAAAKEKADAFLARLKAGEDFDALAREAYVPKEGDDTPFDTARTTGGTLQGSGALAAWLADDARRQGDQDVTDNGTDAYVVARFDRRYRLEVPTATVRHILFAASAPGEDATDTQKETYKFEKELKLQTAQTLYTQWQTGEATEESFAQLARENSADGNASQGGIYEHFPQGQMVAPFDEWVFAQDRQPGDSGIVETEFGYHMMYFVSYDRPEYYYTLHNAIMTERFTEFVDGVTEKYPMSTSRLGLSLNF